MSCLSRPPAAVPPHPAAWPRSFGLSGMPAGAPSQTFARRVRAQGCALTAHRWPALPLLLPVMKPLPRHVQSYACMWRAIEAACVDPLSLLVRRMLYVASWPTCDLRPPRRQAWRTRPAGPRFSRAPTVRQAPSYRQSAVIYHAQLEPAVRTATILNQYFGTAAPRPDS